jgi:hypothetical protein
VDESTSGSQGFALKQHVVEAHVLAHAGASVHQTLQRLGKARRAVAQHGHLHRLSCREHNAPIVLLGKDGRPQRRRLSRRLTCGKGNAIRRRGISPSAEQQSTQRRRLMVPAGAMSGSPAGHKRAAEGGQVADGHDRSPAKTSKEASPRQALPPDAPELDASIDTPPARDDAASTAQVGAADEGMAEDSLQGTDLLSMMGEAGEEELELETELELEAQQLQQSPPMQPQQQQHQQQQQQQTKKKGKQSGGKRKSKSARDKERKKKDAAEGGGNQGF